MTDTTSARKKLEFHRGQRLDRYTLLESLGVGGQAEVWSGWDEEREQVVAIKFIPDSEADSLDGPGSFDREARVVASLDHPNILPVYEVGGIEGFHFLSMRYLPAPSLAEVLESGPLSIERVLRLTAQIASALQYLHFHGIVHRDLKPSNVLLDTQERVYLADFGLAKRVSTTTAVMHTGQGTAPYSPPEQHIHGVVTKSSDIYSLGIMLYRMLTGILPWDGATPLATRQLDSGEVLPDPRDVNPSLPVALAGALRMLTSMNPRKRPDSVGEAFNVVVNALIRQTDATRDLSESELESVLGDIPPWRDPDTIIAEDAESLAQEALAVWDSSTQPFPFGLSQFFLVDACYSRAERYDLRVDETLGDFMLRGALTHARHVDFWWQALADPAARLQVGLEAVAHEGEATAGRALEKMLNELALLPRMESALARLVDLATKALDPKVRRDALDFLGRWTTGVSEWQSYAFTAEGDAQIAALALSEDPFAEKAARLIGQARSERAVDHLLEAGMDADPGRVLATLMTVRDVAGSLPSLTPLAVRLQVGGRLARQQLVADRIGLLKAFAVTALGSVLGVGFHIYSTSRVPSFLDARRLLGAMSAGILFGLVIGLGIFLARLVAHRLRVLSRLPRIAVALILGAPVINLGVVGYHRYFLDRPAMGWLTMMGALLIAVGFAVGAALRLPRVGRIVTSVVAVALAVGLTWQLHLRTLMSPLFYYELDRPLQTAELVVITALLLGAVAHGIDLADA